MWRGPTSRLALLISLLIITISFLSQSVEGDSVTITVQNYHGRPLRGAEVKLINSTNNSIVGLATSDGSGKATINNVEENATYLLQISYKGVLVRELNDWSPTSSPTLFRVSVFDVVIRVFSAGKLDPVPETSVKIKAATTPVTEEEAITDSDGYVTFRNLPGNGTSYYLTINYTLYAEDISRLLVLSADTYEEVYEFELALYRLTILALDRDSRGASGVDVRIWLGERSGRPIQEVMTDSSGRAIFRLLPSGTYFLEFAYKGDVMTAPGLDGITISNNFERAVELPLRRMVVTVNSLKGKLVDGYQLLGRLLTDDRIYSEASASMGKLDFGLVYDRRGYTLQVLFEGEEVYSEGISPAMVGNLTISALFGDFSVSIDVGGLFGELSRLLAMSELRLTVGGFTTTRSLDEGFALFKDHPLVKYRYEIILDSEVIGSGELRVPGHQQRIKIEPKLQAVVLSFLSLNNKPLAGLLEVSWRDVGVIGSVMIEGPKTRIEGLLPLTYEYKFIYRGVVVAEGEIRKELLGGSLNIRSNVADVKITAMDFDAENPLPRAAITLRVAEYNQRRFAGEDGSATFEDAPLAGGWVVIHYRGIKVYSSPITLSPTRTEMVISRTGVYDGRFRVVDGEREPLEGGVIVVSIGDLVIERSINENGIVLVRSLPNGSLTVKVSYLGIDVVDEVHEVKRDDFTLELVAEVYTFSVKVFMQTRGGPEPLSGATVTFSVNGEKKYEARAVDGSVSAKLPVADYEVSVKYQGVPVASSRVAHNSYSELMVEAEVYEVVLNFIDVYEQPLADLPINIRRGGETVFEGSTDINGESVVYLAAADYTVEFSRDGSNYSIPLKVDGLVTESYLHSPDPPSSKFSAIATTSVLAAIAIYGMLRILRGESTTSERTAERGGWPPWRREERRRPRLNI